MLIGDRVDGRGPVQLRSRRVHDRDASRGRGRRHKDLGDVELALLAQRTAFDVDPGQPAHERGHGFDRRSGRRWGVGEQGSAPRELGAARAVGQEAEDAVLGEILTPGMEDRGAADVTTEVARIAAKGGERRSNRVEEQRIEDPGLPCASAFRAWGKVNTMWKYSMGSNSASRRSFDRG
jgi:hypothetical protein